MRALFLVFILMIPPWILAQQVADTSYQPQIQNPAYKVGKGSVIFIDEGHHNFHTKDGRYMPFARLLERDGYQVEAYKGMIEKHELAEAKIMVISNALNELNTEEWYLPNPSAFSESEIETMRQWVYNGGSLFLIADHMPMAGAATDLAKVFGFEFSNGFALDTLSRGPAYFDINNKSLHQNTITLGRDSSETVKRIATFTGQAFQIPNDASPILTFDTNFLNFLPDTAWVFDKSTRIQHIEGWSQGAYKKYGKGRVVVFGEAAMFTAQLAGPQHYRAGMNSPNAPENYQLLLNIIHWLDGIL